MVSGRFRIQKPREGIHRAGQPVIGILSYTISKPTDYRTATLSLIGKAKCQWYNQSGNGTQVYTGYQIILSMHFDILNNRSNETVILPAGTYEFRFQFVLPFEIPSSFKDRYSHIEYHLVAKFEKFSLFSFTRKFKRKIPVYGYVHPTVSIEPVSYEIRKVLFQFFSSKKHVVHVKAQITKSLLAPGENAELHLIVTNDTDTDINYVSTTLMSKTSYFSSGSVTYLKIVKKKHQYYMIMDSNVPQYKISELTCLVPTLPELYSLDYCKIIKKEFFLQLTVGLSFPHKNPSVDIPIAIGEGRFGDSSGVIEFDNLDEVNDGDFYSYIQPNCAV